MEQIVARLETAADELSTAGRELPAYGLSRLSFGADSLESGLAGGGGLPGRVAAQIHEHWSAVLAARAHEASDSADQLRDLLTKVRVTAEDYAHTDTAVAHRLRRDQ